MNVEISAQRIIIQILCYCQLIVVQLSYFRNGMNLYHSRCPTCDVRDKNRELIEEGFDESSEKAGDSFSINSSSYAILPLLRCAKLTDFRVFSRRRYKFLKLENIYLPRRRQDLLLLYNFGVAWGHTNDNHDIMIICIVSYNKRSAFLWRK